MGKKTGVPWADRSHGFWYGCKKVSAGCKNCYAERDMKRFDGDFDTVTRAKGFDKPLSWKQPGLVFVNPWSDFFHPAADKWRDDAWDIMRRTPHLTYLVLTKRSLRLYEVEDCPPNVWLGVTIEDAQSMIRFDHLFSTDAATTFVSLEPLLGSLAGDWIADVGWVIVGCESGPERERRPMELDWVRALRDECVKWDVPFFFKQAYVNGELVEMPELDGQVWNQMPVGRTEFPPEPVQGEQLSLF